MLEVRKSDIKKWVKALRSGKYLQGKGRLQIPNTNAYCCLGVACNIFIPEDLQVRHPVDGNLLGGCVSTQQHAPMWLRFINEDFAKRSRNKSTDQPPSLIYLNDDAGMTFNEIADLLEMVYIHRVLD